jgi:hypothetical protein
MAAPHGSPSGGAEPGAPRPARRLSPVDRLHPGPAELPPAALDIAGQLRDLRLPVQVSDTGRHERL